MVRLCHMPASGTAHFGVDVTFERVVDWQQFSKVDPRQLCAQCVHNLVVGKKLGNADHVKQVSAIKAPPVFRSHAIWLDVQLRGFTRPECC